MARLLGWLGGPLIWAAHFLIVYGSESLFCTRGTAGAYPAFLAIVTAAALAGLGVLILREARLTRNGTGAHFMDRLSLLLSVAGAIAVVATSLPILLVPACISFAVG